jgi:hypothetical protein
MTDTEQDVRRALRNMLNSIEPAPSVHPRTVRRAKARRATSATVAGVLVDH